MRPSRPFRSLLLLPAVLLVAGCFKLSRESPPLRQYVLGGAAPLVAGTPTPTTGLTVGVRRIEIASYLSDPAIVVRRGTNLLDVSDFHRWGEDPDEGINRAFASHLAVSPPVRSADVAPWPARTTHDFLVQLRVSRFEGAADSAAAAGSTGRVHVATAWDIIRPLDGRVLMRGSTEDREGTFRVGDYTALVTGLDAALARVARDVSACLARFPNDSTPPASCAPAPR